jgi:predicted nucleic acid-binding Zn ribbon protein
LNEFKLFNKRGHYCVKCGKLTISVQVGAVLCSDKCKNSANFGEVGGKNNCI